LVCVVAPGQGRQSLGSNRTGRLPLAPRFCADCGSCIPHEHGEPRLYPTLQPYRSAPCPLVTPGCMSPSSTAIGWRSSSKAAQRGSTAGGAANGRPACPAWSTSSLGIARRSAIIDADLVLPGAGGVPDFVHLHLRMRRHRQALLVYPSICCTVMAGISARCRSPSAAAGGNGSLPGRACSACAWWRHLTAGAAADSCHAARPSGRCLQAEGDALRGPHRTGASSRRRRGVRRTGRGGGCLSADRAHITAHAPCSRLD
jgi:hypothetical protein